MHFISHPDISPRKRAPWCPLGTRWSCPTHYDCFVTFQLDPVASKFAVTPDRDRANIWIDFRRDRIEFWTQRRINPGEILMYFEDNVF